MRTHWSLVAAFLASITLAACGGSSTSDTVDAAGADALPSGTPSLTVTVTTTPSGGNYAPKNVVVAWVEQNGTFVKTIQRRSGQRTRYLLSWRAAAGTSDVDAVTGATRANHATPLMFVWDLKDRNGVIVPDGTYTIRMELADRDTTNPSSNNQGTFTFEKGPTAQTQPGLSNGGFNAVTLDFSPG